MASNPEPDIPPIVKGQNYSITQLHNPSPGAKTIVDIVFVHGLTGNAYSTWLHKSTNVHWPSMLLKNNIPDARILTFGYDADIVNWWSQASNNRVGNHADNLLGALVRLREDTESEERKIIFVAHSLGGLVTEMAIGLSRRSPFEYIRRIETHTVGIVFLGTPHFGADAAKWGSYGANLIGIVRQTNSPIVKVLRPDSEMLASIQRDFQGVLRQRIDERTAIDITCFFEELPVRLVGEVGKDLLSCQHYS